MYYMLSLAAGMLISIMVAFNGMLTQQYGIWFAAIIIHIAGLFVISCVCIIKRDRVFSRLQPWYMYSAGALGVATTVFNNFAFGRIGVSAILALGLFGQAIMGIAVDKFGFFGMPRHAFAKRKLAGLVLMMLGIGVMLGQVEIAAMAVSLAAGINIVISRSINAGLAAKTSVYTGTFYNYVIGLAVAGVVFVVAAGPLPQFGIAHSMASPWIYLGGVLGVCVVVLSNITVVKISALYLTQLFFVGKISAGILVDMLLTGAFSTQNLYGGALVAIGLCVNLVLDNRK